MTTMAEPDDNHGIPPAQPAQAQAQLRVTNPYLKPKTNTIVASVRQVSTSSSIVTPPLDALTTISKQSNNHHHHHQKDNDDDDDGAETPVSHNDNDEDNDNDEEKGNNGSKQLCCLLGTSATFGIKESAVERLPSRNVSIQSAEILTVTELHQHFELYHNAAVRITGVVQHFLMLEGGHCCLVLSNPCYYQHAVTTTTMSTTKKKKRNQPRSPILKTPSVLKPSRPSSLTTTTATSTPRFVTSVHQTNVVVTPRFIGGRKRPLSSLKKTPMAVSTTTKSPLELAVQSLIEQPTILVVIQQQQEQTMTVAVHDLVMIIGELRECHHDDDDDNPATGSSSNDDNDGTLRKALQPIVQKWNEHNKLLLLPPEKKYVVQARIVRNVNGMDISLHDEALQLRRRHLLQQTHHASSPSSSSSSSLLQGCGPPPYYRYSTTQQNDDSPKETETEERESPHDVSSF